MDLKFTYPRVVLDQGLGVPCEPLLQLYSTCGGASTETPKKGKGGGAICGETQGGEDPPEGRDHSAWDGRQRGGRVKRQDLNQVGIKAEMTGHYLGEFSITYSP